MIKMRIRDDKLVSEILLNGGITFDVKTNTKIIKHYGYMVAIEGCESKVAIEDFTKVQLDDYIEVYLNILNQTEYYLGAWVHEGFVYLDVSKYSEKLRNAEWLGVFENQIAIFDLENFEEITLDYKKIKARNEVRHNDFFKDKDLQVDSPKILFS